MLYGPLHTEHLGDFMLRKFNIYGFTCHLIAEIGPASDTVVLIKVHFQGAWPDLQQSVCPNNSQLSGVHMIILLLQIKLELLQPQIIKMKHV